MLRAWRLEPPLGKEKRKIGEESSVGTASHVCALLTQDEGHGDFLVHIGEIDGCPPHCCAKREIPVLLKWRYSRYTL